MRLGWLILCLVFTLCEAAPAEAQVAPQPEVSLSYWNLFGVRVNPLGLVDYARFSLRLRLYEDDSDILKQNYIGIGVAPALSPAWGRVGLLAEIQPLTILRLYAQYDFIGIFGSFDQLGSYPSATGNYSDTERAERVERPGEESYVSYGGIFTVGATLQLKIGPIAARSLFRAVHTSYEVRSGDRVFYDAAMDILLPNDGWMMINDLDLLGVFDVDEFSFAVGARWTYTHSFYDDGHYAPGEDTSLAPDNDIHRLGPLLAWVIDSDPGARFDRPTLLFLAQWHLVHRYRTGADVTVALPYMVLAFSFQGDLLADH